MPPALLGRTAPLQEARGTPQRVGRAGRHGMAKAHLTRPDRLTSPEALALRSQDTFETHPRRTPGRAMLRPAAHRPKEPALAFPRLRYMGSKYRLLPALRAVFATLGFDSALDPFSGSAVLAHALKGMGKRVTASDYLEFAATVARATVENDRVRLGEAAVERLCGPPPDDRDFILRTFRGRFFPDEDLRFLDAAWSHLDRMAGHERDLAIAALCLAAARKQPRGVFTVTGLRYDDGRRRLRLPLRDHFREAAAAYNAAVLDTGRPCRAARADVFDTDPAGHDLVYLDPPYAPP